MRRKFDRFLLRYNISAKKILFYSIISAAGICLYLFSTNILSSFLNVSNDEEPLPFLTETDPTFSKPIILEWNKYWTEIPYDNYECANSCIFTKNVSFENDATLITFHYPDINYSYLPQLVNYKRMNVFVSFESPADYPYPKELADNFFNATISYMQNSDYPVLYDCFKNLTENDTDKWHDNEIDEILSKKNKSIVTFVSNCQTNSNRELLIPALEYYVNVTKYGVCYNRKCEKDAECEKEEQERHFFVLALENSHCTDYFSEKVWRLRNLIVPIIMDRKLLKGELAYLNPFVIALSDFKTVKGFAEYLIYLMNNKREYRKYFEWTKFYQKSKGCDFLPALPCKICELALKVKYGYRKEMDSRKWWNDGINVNEYVLTWLKSALKNLFFILPHDEEILIFSNQTHRIFSKPIILEWNKYWTEIPYDDYECANSCIFTKNGSFEKDATLIVFHFHNVNYSYLPQSINYNRMNVFVSFESPGNHPYPVTFIDNFFNATISYMQNSDYPVLYDCFKNLTENDTDKWNDNEIDEILSKKNKSIVTFVSNCQTNSKREMLIPVLERFINITKYGKCYQNDCQLNADCEEEELERHFFVLALENSHCIDYFSEKVWRLRNLIVPIIMDRKLLKGELAYLNPFVIALSDFKTVKGFAEYLIYLMNNKREYKKYFEWTKFYKKSKSCGMLPALSCKLCELAMKVKYGYRKEMNARKWWNDNTFESDYVKTWLKSAYRKSDD